MYPLPPAADRARSPLRRSWRWGHFPPSSLTGKALPLGQLRGEVYSYQGVPVVVTYHPAALLRNPGWTRATWDDLQLLRQVMDGA